jgi:hypothetical protein
MSNGVYFSQKIINKKVVRATVNIMEYHFELASQKV